MPKVGVLALQGDFIEHVQVLNSLGVETREVRLPGQLDGVDGLIIPGGESTTIVKLIDMYGFRTALHDAVGSGMAVWGTCAGMIAIASRLTGKDPVPLGLIDITVSRNAFGRQVDSFEADLPFDGIGKEPFHAVFIRAPVVKECGLGVKVLARVEDGDPVAVRSGRLMATAFHPELTGDDRIHRYFLELSNQD